jgi:hypothetical protein
MVKPNIPTRSWAKGIMRNVTEENISMANKLVKKCPTSLVI